jgi:hypothetical protein
VKIKKRGTGGYDEIPILAEQVDKAKAVRVKRASDKLDDFIQMNTLQHADEKEVPKIAARTAILPIELMEKDDRFKARFDRGGYDPTLIKIELSILDSQAGGNQPEHDANLADDGGVNDARVKMKATRSTWLSGAWNHKKILPLRFPM